MRLGLPLPGLQQQRGQCYLKHATLPTAALNARVPERGRGGRPPALPTLSRAPPSNSSPLGPHRVLTRSSLALELVPHNRDLLRELVPVLGVQVALHVLQHSSGSRSSSSGGDASGGGVREGGCRWGPRQTSPPASPGSTARHAVPPPPMRPSGAGLGISNYCSLTSISLSMQAARSCWRSGGWLATICCLSCP